MTVASVLDRRMAEIAAQRAAQRAAEREAERGQDSTGQNRIEQSTDTINRGMRNPVVWLLCTVGIVAIPFTGGLSIGAIIVGLLIATAGGKACAQAVAPTTADLAAPGPGCVRILAALGVTILMIAVILLFLAAVAYDLGVKP